MKNIFKISFLLIVMGLTSCMNSTDWELTGVQGRRPWFHPQPYGTVYIPTGTYHSGQK